MQLPIDPSRYAAFLGMMAAMAISPGPSCFFCIATGMKKGHRAALLGVLGLNVGSLLWFSLAALGLDATLTAFPKLFHTLTHIGAVYLFWLSFNAFNEAFSKKLSPLPMNRKFGRSAFTDGLMVQITNPKALLFFTALLPPFIDAAKPALPQLLLIAAGFFVIDTIIMTIYGLGGATLRSHAENTRFRRGLAFIIGLLLLTAAVLISIYD
jgi:threonine/homoserine/homoserine lactone efflux protein